MTTDLINPAHISTVFGLLAIWTFICMISGQMISRESKNPLPILAIVGFLTFLVISVWAMVKLIIDNF